jgi:hypothetical protein
MRHGGSMIGWRSWMVASMVLAGLACGPAVELDEGSGSGTGASTGMTEPTVGESVDESGGGSSPCGVGDTELIGGGPPGPLGYPPPCRPLSDSGTNGYRCCSDDPATLDGQLPAYEGKNIEGGSLPSFSGANNELSSSGMCVDVSQLAGLGGLTEAAAEDCPIPCNPTWDESSIDEVCGSGRSCCQTVELQPEDCVLDAVTGLYRPVTGEDIGVLTQWRPTDHATHQDPNGVRCLALAGGDSGSEIFEGCVRELSVADQRGFCMALSAAQACPHEQPSYVDACEQLNGG